LTPDSPGGVNATLYPLATASQIASGDVLIARQANADGTVTETPATLNFVFNTTPALSAWTSTGGNSGTVTYPAAPGAPGTQDNPFTIAPGPDGHYVAKLTFWRPQRKGIAGAGESAGFMDIGHLLWQARVIPMPDGPDQQNENLVIDCAGPGIYSTDDPNLVPNEDNRDDGFVDTAADTPADPSHTLSYTLDISACLATHGKSWPSGRQMQVEITARGANGDNSSQELMFRAP
jgi:hypothetical protein